MNSSVTPSIPLGSSLSGPLPLPACFSSKCVRCTTGLFWSGWLPLHFLRWKKLVVLGSGGHQQFGFWNPGATLLNLLSEVPWWPLGSLHMSSPADLPSGRLPLLLIIWVVHHRSDPSSMICGKAIREESG